MTENEAKIFIQNAMEQSKNVLAELMLIMPKVFAAKRKSLGEYYSNLENCKKRNSVMRGGDQGTGRGAALAHISNQP